MASNETILLEENKRLREELEMMKLKEYKRVKTWYDLEENFILTKDGNKMEIHRIDTGCFEFNDYIVYGTCVQVGSKYSFYTSEVRAKINREDN